MRSYLPWDQARHVATEHSQGYEYTDISRGAGTSSRYSICFLRVLKYLITIKACA